MLEQIVVLGQVPGTNIRISFAAYSIAIILTGVAALGYIHRGDIDRKRREVIRQRKIEQQAI